MPPSPASNHPDLAERIFVGVFPTGIVYADRKREKGGDYARLAFLPYSTLALKIEPDCPAALRTWIELDAASIASRRGQAFEISTSGQTVMLGADQAGRWAPAISAVASRRPKW